MITVHQLPETCNGPQNAVVSDNGFIVSPTGMSSYGRCPLKIQSKSGKQLNITIQRFSSDASNDKSSNPPVCHSAVNLKEAGKPMKNVLLCPSDAKNKSVYLSQSEELEVTFPNVQQKTDAIFLLHYQGM